MKKMSSILIKAGIAVMLAFAVIVCPGSIKPGNTPTISKTFTLDEPGTLDVQTSGGKISVEGQDGNKVEVQAFIRKNGNLLDSSSPQISEILEDYELIIEKNGTAITATAKRINDRLSIKNINISFNVLVPHKVSCNLRTSGGGLYLLKVEGTHNLMTSGGGIHISNTKGAVDAKTSGGGIRVAEQYGDMILNTSGGSINISESKGNISGHTSGGHISLDNVKGNVDVHTSGGGININGIAESLKATTSGGGIKVNITGLSEELYLKTSGGGINAVIPGGMGLDLDLRATKVNVDLQNFSGNARKGRVEGKMLGGGIPVLMHTSGGNIDLEFK